jgi:hypothetical protein
VVLQDDSDLEEGHPQEQAEASNPRDKSYGVQSDAEGPEGSEFDSDGQGFTTELDVDTDADQSGEAGMDIYAESEDDDEDMFVPEEKDEEDEESMSDDELVEVKAAPKRAKVRCWSPVSVMGLLHIPKAKRGDLRAAVNTVARLTTSLPIAEQGPTSLKRKLDAEAQRKQESNATDSDRVKDKRAKHQEPPSGLLGDFKKRLKASREVIVKGMDSVPSLVSDILLIHMHDHSCPYYPRGGEGHS